jgi:Family of unknown function (DUF6247)
MPATTTIFQASDLNRRGRAVLDTARDGLARIRDTDGEGLVVAREDAYEAMRRQLLVFRELADAMASYITLDRAVDHEHRRPSLAELGSWTWVRHLPSEDAAEFVRDISEALYASCRELSATPLAEVIDAWRATAESLSDPLSRETLLGQSSADDYVEAARPEAKVDTAVGSNP